MKYVPFVAHLEAWKKSFKTDASNRHPGRHKRWIVSYQKGEGEETPICLVTPTQQAIERAQSEINDMRKRGAPIPKFKTKLKLWLAVLVL